MNFRAISIGAALLAGGVFLGKAVFSQEGRGGMQGQEGEMPDMAEMMEKWKEAMEPGENHKLLDYFVGKWDVKTKFWMAGPDAPAMESPGSAEVKWVLDGRFLFHESTGQMMGMPFKGMGLTGYDNFKGLYVTCWADTMSTALQTAFGTADESGKVFTYEGLMDEPMTGEKDKKVRMIEKILGPDRFVFEIHDLVFPEGKTKVGEMTYTRKK